MPAPDSRIPTPAHRSQQQLFGDEAAPWEDDAAGEQMVATIVLPTGAKQLYDYAVGDELRGSVEPGRRVKVPFGHGNRPVIGYCVSVEYRQVTGRPLKQVREVIDERSLLSPSMLRLTRWIADHYL